MDQKSIMLTRRRMNELASSHNKLTTLVACLLNEINSMKKEMSDSKGGDDNNSNKTHNNSSNTSNASNSSNGQNSRNPNRFPNFNELRAEEILKQLTINTNDN